MGTFVRSGSRPSRRRSCGNCGGSPIRARESPAYAARKARLIDQQIRLLLALAEESIAVDPFHLFRYLDEQAYRFNNREENDLGRFVGVLRDVIGKRLTYAELISADMAPATT